MSPEMLAALIGGSFALVGIVVGAGLTSLQTYLSYRRQKADELVVSQERERAILHGAFAVCNFLAERLNDWDVRRNIYALARAAVAQSFLASLIEKSPQESARLMVSLVDLGIRLDAMLFATGFSIGARPDQPSDAEIAEVLASVEELSRAVEIVQLLLDGELPIMSEGEINLLIKEPAA